MFGERGLFHAASTSRIGFHPDKCVSYYETSVIKRTLESGRFRSDQRHQRHAVERRCGQRADRPLCLFRQRGDHDPPEHIILASGAFATGCSPPVEIDGEHIGMEDTALEHTVATHDSYYPRRSRLVFQVDLFPAHGCVPTNRDEVDEREKDIRYSSRTNIISTNSLREKHECRYAINERTNRCRADLCKYLNRSRTNLRVRLRDRYGIVQLIYRLIEPQGAPKDFELAARRWRRDGSRESSDVCSNLHASPWLVLMPRD